jgi:hypothetical protein
MLGITTGAVRNRLSRGTLRSSKEDGTVYVLLPADMSRDADRDTDDTLGDMPPPERDTLTSEQRDRLHYIEGQLEAERQATPKSVGSSPDWWSASRGHRSTCRATKSL